MDKFEERETEKIRPIKKNPGHFLNKKIIYYKPKTVSNFCNNNYIEYQSNGDKNRNLSLDKYLIKIKPYMRNIIINLQNSDTWKIQLTIAINFISSKEAEEEHVMQMMLLINSLSHFFQHIDKFRNINERK